MILMRPSCWTMNNRETSAGGDTARSGRTRPEATRTVVSGVADAVEIPSQTPAPDGVKELRALRNTHAANVEERGPHIARLSEGGVRPSLDVTPQTFNGMDSAAQLPTGPSQPRLA